MLPQEFKEVKEDIIDKASECLEYPKNPIERLEDNAKNYDIKKATKADEIEGLKDTTAKSWKQASES